MNDAADAGTPVACRFGGVLLLQPEAVMQVRAPSPRLLADYLRALQSAVRAQLARRPPRACSGHLVVAVRPGGQVASWCDLQPALPAAEWMQLHSVVRAVAPFEARGGMVAFALPIGLAGAPVGAGMPSPPEWRQAAAALPEPITFEALISAAWPFAHPQS